MMSSDRYNLNVDLSQNEARVLHSLVRMPNYSDQIIHSAISMKKSTFSSIKTRLKEQNYYNRYYVPNFPKIGFELLMMSHGRLNQFSSFEERMRVAGDMFKSFIEDFHTVSEGNQKYSLAIAENLTEFSKNHEKFLSLYQMNNFFGKKPVESIAFPFEISRIHSFMDFETLVAEMFGFASEPYESRKIIPTGRVKPVKLTRAEKKVLVGLVKYPEESDTLIANNIEVSRNTVANAKRKFLQSNICFPRVVPNFMKLGLNTLQLTYRKFNTKLTSAQREEAVEKVRELYAPFFYVSNDIEGFFISVHTSEDELKKVNEEMSTYYQQMDYLLEEPVSYILDVNSMHFLKFFDFLPGILKFYGFDKDFGNINA